MTDEEHRAELERLMALPYRGACSECPGRMWFAETEEQVRARVMEHMASHVLVWTMQWDPPTPPTATGGVEGSTSGPPLVGPEAS